jgi:hypothetical protein
MSEEDYKAVESYSAAQNAWYNTQIEYDKSLLTLSTAGLGFVIALLNTAGVTSAESLILNLLAIISFLISMGSVLFIFKKNGTYLHERLMPKAQVTEPPTHSCLLGLLDNLATISFALGIVFSTILAISVALNSYSQHKEKIVADKNQQSENTTLRESFNQAPLEKKSFNQAPIVQPVQKPVETGSTTTTKQDVKEK